MVADRFPTGKRRRSLAPAVAGTRRRRLAAAPASYSCNCRFSDSTSSESAMSFATSASILRTACSTVV